MPRECEHNGQSCLEINCGRHQLARTSIGHGPNGTVYRCDCGPLTDEELARLEGAAARGILVRLVFPSAEVVLTQVSIERASPGWATIAGRVVSAPPLHARQNS